MKIGQIILTVSFLGIVIVFPYVYSMCASGEEAVTSGNILKARIEEVELCGFCENPGVCAPCPKRSHIKIMQLPEGGQSDSILAPTRVLYVNDNDRNAYFNAKALEIGRCYAMNVSSHQDSSSGNRELYFESGELLGGC